MLNLDHKFRSMSVFILGMSLLCSGALAQNNDNRGDHRDNGQGDRRGNNVSDNRGDRRDNNGGTRMSDHRNDNNRGDHGRRYHYRDGHWYGRGWFGWEFGIAALTVGAIIEALPPNHSIIVVGDTSYYYDNTVYYRQLPDGAYVVVPAPR